MKSIYLGEGRWASKRKLNMFNPLEPALARLPTKVNSSSVLEKFEFFRCLKAFLSFNSRFVSNKIFVCNEKNSNEFVIIVEFYSKLKFFILLWTSIIFFLYLYICIFIFPVSYVKLDSNHSTIFKNKISQNLIFHQI